MEFWIVNNSTLREFAFLYFFQCFLDVGLSTSNTGLRPSTLDISASTELDEKINNHDDQRNFLYLN